MRQCSPPPCVTCQVSSVTCHVSGVMCQVSHVRYHAFFLQTVWASRCRVCYHRGLLRLVSYSQSVKSIKLLFCINIFGRKKYSLIIFLYGVAPLLAFPLAATVSLILTDLFHFKVLLKTKTGKRQRKRFPKA